MNGRTCAFLTMENTAGWAIDADLAIAPLQALGWQVEWISWRRPDVNWSHYDAVYIGTPWDYPDDPELFMSVLIEIDRSPAALVNDIALVHWNLSKTYLRDLEQRGADIVPSIWCDTLREDRLDSSFDEHATGSVIVKPVVSTNATDTFMLPRKMSANARERVLSVFVNRGCVVQPFIANIQSEGEYSLFYFGNEFSHAILKTPKTDDFRVQEEHGASLLPVDPEDALRAAADHVLGLVTPEPVYARCDFVRAADGRFLVMELELIEPSMYLRMQEGSAEKFAAAFHRYVLHAGS